jgi:hypothetical protein
MKKTLTTAALALALALGATTASAKMGRHHKHSPEHAAAVKKCQDDYAEAGKDAKTKKGKERAEALKAAQKTRKDCLAAAPK